MHVYTTLTLINDVGVKNYIECHFAFKNMVLNDYLVTSPKSRSLTTSSVAKLNNYASCDRFLEALLNIIFFY